MLVSNVLSNILFSCMYNSVKTSGCWLWCTVKLSCLLEKISCTTAPPEADSSTAACSALPPAVWVWVGGWKEPLLDPITPIVYYFPDRFFNTSLTTVMNTFIFFCGYYYYYVILLSAWGWVFIRRFQGMMQHNYLWLLV